MKSIRSLAMTLAAVLAVLAGFIGLETAIQKPKAVVRTEDIRTALQPLGYQCVEETSVSVHIESWTSRVLTRVKHLFGPGIRGSPSDDDIGVIQYSWIDSTSRKSCDITAKERSSGEVQEVYVTSTDHELHDAVVKFLKSKFPGLPVLNEPF